MIDLRGGRPVMIRATCRRCASGGPSRPSSPCRRSSKPARKRPLRASVQQGDRHETIRPHREAARHQAREGLELERSSRQGRSLAGCKSPHRQLPVFGRLAYPMRGEATNRVLLGRKSPGCPAGVFAAVGTIWGASKLGGRNITKYLQPRKSPLARSRFKRDNCGKPTHFPLGKADGTVEETGVSTRCTAGVGDPASKNRLLEITSGSCRGQQGLVTTCKDSPNEAKNRRRREPNGSGE